MCGTGGVRAREGALELVLYVHDRHLNLHSSGTQNMHVFCPRRSVKHHTYSKIQIIIKL